MSDIEDLINFEQAEEQEAEAQKEKAKLVADLWERIKALEIQLNSCKDIDKYEKIFNKIRKTRDKLYRLTCYDYPY